MSSIAMHWVFGSVFKKKQPALPSEARQKKKFQTKISKKKSLIKNHK
jgi:hypothetical protein